MFECDVCWNFVQQITPLSQRKISHMWTLPLSQQPNTFLTPHQWLSTVLVFYKESLKPLSLDGMLATPTIFWYSSGMDSASSRKLARSYLEMVEYRVLVPLRLVYPVGGASVIRGGFTPTHIKSENSKLFCIFLCSVVRPWYSGGTSSLLCNRNTGTILTFKCFRGVFKICIEAPAEI